MKAKILALIIIAISSSPLHAQFKTLGNKIKQKTEQKANQKTDQAIDKGLDKVEGAATGKQEEDGNAKTEDQAAGDNKNSGDEANTNEGQSKGEAGAAPVMTFTSKYDFVQGEKVIAYEDFGNVAIGDFPTRWNTNGSAEVVTINQREGKWLKINTRGTFMPEFITSIPENSTLEFDLGVNNGFQWGSSNMTLYITELENKDKFTSSGYYGHSIDFDFHPLTGENHTGGVHFRTFRGSNDMDNSANAKKWDAKTNVFAHVSVWRQGQRMRLYVNGDKVFDLPRAFKTDGKYNAVIFESGDLMTDKGDFYLLGNIRLADGAPDTRNKLITEGKFVTSGITFDVNSDKIKQESNGVLKEIAAVLTENPAVKIKIVGHTDSDGDATKNLKLSQQRAASVKNALAASYNIDAARIETDGMGSSKPVADNKTAEGKAQNRRVEFIKQ